METRTLQASVVSARAGLALTTGIAIVLFAWAPDAGAKSQGPPCEKAELKLAATGRGDADQDGISDCREKLLGTLSREDDTDGDGVEDGAELQDGTSPLDADSDDDGLDDGDEAQLGTDPHDVDSDHDGEDDGCDADPAGELVSKVESDVQALVCPTVEANGSITLLGIEIVLTSETVFEHLASCDELASLIETVSGAHVEVEVEEVGVELVARKVEIEDHDHDGSPDDVDHDDDDDGVDDDHDDD